MKDMPKDTLMIDIGAPKGGMPPKGSPMKAPGSDPGMPAADDNSDSYDAEVDSFADEAFSALKSGDKEGFKTALRGMVESCMPMS